MMIDRLTGGKREKHRSSFNELEMTLLNEQLQEIIHFLLLLGMSLDLSNAKLSLH